MTKQIYSPAKYIPVLRVIIDTCKKHEAALQAQDSIRIYSFQEAEDETSHIDITIRDGNIGFVTDSDLETVESIAKRLSRYSERATSSTSPTMMLTKFRDEFRRPLGNHLATQALAGLEAQVAFYEPQDPTTPPVWTTLD